jgi:hypothetical protein
VARRDPERPLKIHQRRDLGAAFELLPVLLQVGYEFGESILNFPPQAPPQGSVARGEVQLQEVDLSFVRPGDLLLQTTRPPLDDLAQGARKRVQLGYTDLERRLFERWRHYLRVCSRSHVTLAERVCAELKPGYENRGDIRFREAMTAPYKELNPRDGTGWGRPESDRLTAAFLLRVDHIWENGPGLLAAFGMDGTSTLVWTYRLGRDLSGLLSNTGFIMAEMESTPIPTRPTDLRWANSWKIDILAHAKQ